MREVKERLSNFLEVTVHNVTYLSSDLFNSTAQTFNHPCPESLCRGDQQTFIEPRLKALFLTQGNLKITLSTYSLNTF